MNERSKEALSKAIAKLVTQSRGDGTDQAPSPLTVVIVEKSFNNHHREEGWVDRLAHWVEERALKIGICLLTIITLGGLIVYKSGDLWKMISPLF